MGAVAQESQRFVDIDVEMIGVPPNRRITLKMDDEKTQMFVESIQKLGVLQPIEVRELADGRYELVFGRRRLAAAKKLGLPTIPAVVATWTDEQIKAVTIAENAHRQHLSPAQHVKHVQALLEEFHKHFGPDPGKRASGLATAAKAKRDKVSKKFVPSASVASQDIEPVKETAEAPVVPESGNAGSTLTRSHSALLAESTGRHRSMVNDDLILARAFNQETLDVFDMAGTPREGMLRLAKAGLDPDVLELVISKIVVGTAVDEAIAEAKQELGIQTDDDLEAARLAAEDALPDDEWLNTYCGELRSQIEDPVRYDTEALLYRATKAIRSEFRSKFRRELLRIRKGGFSPLNWHLCSISWVGHPSTWHLCHSCQGKNGGGTRSNECDLCRGAGYRLKLEIPREIKD